MDRFGQLQNEEDDFDEKEFDYDDDFVSEDELDFQPERNVFERVGIQSDKIHTGIDIEHIKDPFERFTVQVDAISRNLIHSGINISDKDIENMIDKINSISSIEYKNPTGFVLGYIASQNGNVLEKKRLEYVFKAVLPYISDESINKSDIVRYARYWHIVL